MHKTCKKCLVEKPETEFYRHFSKCKFCVLADQKTFRENPEVRERLSRVMRERRKLYPESFRQYEQKRSKLRKKKFLEAIDKYFPAKVCVVCGYNKCFGAIDFHHLDPKKKEFSPKVLMRTAITKGEPSKGTIKKLKKELQKCVPLCSNCHREYHAGLIILENFTSVG